MQVQTCAEYIIYVMCLIKFHLKSEPLHTKRKKGRIFKCWGKVDKSRVDFADKRMIRSKIWTTKTKIERDKVLENGRIFSLGTYCETKT